MNKPTSIPVYRTLTLVDGEEVEVFNICEVIDRLFPVRLLMPHEQPSYEVTRAAVAAWAAEHGAAMYAADREEFSLYDAAHQAVDQGLRRVVVEDLS